MRVARVASLIAVAAAAGAVAASGAGATAAMAPCSVRDGAIAGLAGSHVLAMAGATVVYRVRGGGLDEWWACRRGRAARAAIGSEDAYQRRNDEYGPTRTLRDLRVAGRWVVAVGASGLADYEACTKYQQSACVGPTETLVAVDAAAGGGAGALTRFQTDTSDASGNGTDVAWRRLLLSPSGAVVWLLRSEPFSLSTTPPAPTPTFTIDGCVLADGSRGPTCTPAHLASDAAISPASLALSGTTLTWTDGGQPRSASLR